MVKTGFRWRWAAVLGIALAAGIGVAILAVYFPPLLLALAALTIKGVAPFAFLATVPLSAAAVILGSIAAVTFGAITVAASLLLSGAFNLFAAAFARLGNLSEAISPEAGPLVEDTDYAGSETSAQIDFLKAIEGSGKAGPSYNEEGSTDDWGIDDSGYFADTTFLAEPESEYNEAEDLLSTPPFGEPPQPVGESPQPAPKKKSDRECCSFFRTLFPSRKQSSNVGLDGPGFGC